ncbi:MAG TPA: cupin domain-containing protein [Nannocystaceae bacterium]|nr:cupin domain-containing protein [Nannocystaceae bacterium]
MSARDDDRKHTRMDSADARPTLSRAPTPNVPIRSHELAFDIWHEGARFGGAELALGRLGGARDVGVNLVELAPHRQSCPLHWHLREEEHFYVLEGRCVLRSGDERHEMSAGDYVCFPAGTRVAHAFENPHAEPCRLLAIGTRVADEIAVYPESGKMKLRALDAIVEFPPRSLDYWHGEHIDIPLGTDPALHEEAQRELAERERAAERAVDDELTAMKKRLGLE